MDKKRFIKEKARYAFIRERTREIRERPRHRTTVPGLDYAEDIQGRDTSEPGEREAAVDRTEDMAISSLGYTEKALKYAKRKYRENVSHCETHFERGGASAAAAENIPEMCFTVRHISMGEAAHPRAKELLWEKAVEEYKAGQIQKQRRIFERENRAETYTDRQGRYEASVQRRPRTASGMSKPVQRAEQSVPRQGAANKSETIKTQGRRLAQRRTVNQIIAGQSRKTLSLERLKEAALHTAGSAGKSMAFGGGAALALLVPLLLIFAVAGAMFEGSVDLEKAPVSDEVKAYAGLIQAYAMEQGIPEYSGLIMAVMMQESGGRGNDPMQASESGFNTKYPNTPGGISDPEYSIEVGVQAFANVLRQAGVQGIDDEERLYIALQAYNFGPGYISYAMNNGGHSAFTALAFSEMMAQQMGWTSYGDPQYVQHVLRYYEPEE